jgi:hypothetical protein
MNEIQQSNNICNSNEVIGNNTIEYNGIFFPANFHLRNSVLASSVCLQTHFKFVQRPACIHARPMAQLREGTGRKMSVSLCCKASTGEKVRSTHEGRRAQGGVRQELVGPSVANFPLLSHHQFGVGGRDGRVHGHHHARVTEKIQGRPCCVG